MKETLRQVRGVEDTTGVVPIVGWVAFGHGLEGRAFELSDERVALVRMEHCRNDLQVVDVVHCGLFTVYWLHNQIISHKIHNVKERNMARPSNTEPRRAQIVDGLLSVMRKEGYAGASVVEIARAAGLASGLVHYHFPNKQAILLALVHQLAEVFEARYDGRLQAADKNPLARLDAFIDAHLALDETADPRAVTAWVVIGSEAVIRPEVQEVYEPFLTRRLRELEGIVRDCVQNELQSPQSRAIAAMLMAAIEGAFLMSAAAPGAMPSGSAAPTLRTAARALVGDRTRETN
jgi:TetR/AcrR family transcriptional repressor of bet genes